MICSIAGSLTETVIDICFSSTWKTWFFTQWTWVRVCLMGVEEVVLWISFINTVLMTKTESVHWKVLFVTGSTKAADNKGCCLWYALAFVVTKIRRWLTVISHQLCSFSQILYFIPSVKYLQKVKRTILLIFLEWRKMTQLFQTSHFSWFCWIHTKTSSKWKDQC